MSGALTVGWLYPDLMNIYGDRGNILTLVHRARWRGIEARVLELGKGISEGIEAADIMFFGGGQDKEQALVYQDLLDHKAAALERAAARGAVILAVCGGYQLLGHYYQTADPALGLDPATLVGFENHSGRTFLGPGARPLGSLRLGHGNNGDGGEGAVSGNLFGTYLHGSLLPKNPHLADLLLERALGRRLERLDDSLELLAHRRLVARAPGPDRQLPRAG